MKSCNPSFTSQYAFLDNQHITITDYLKKRDEYYGKALYCNKGHELTAVNCNKRQKHFRHLHNSDTCGNPMSEWHADWQGNFADTEISFPKNTSEQLKERRADAVLNDTTIIEFQHSKIELVEVSSRKKDYSLHSKEIIWIIDGNYGIEVKELQGSERVFLDFSPYCLWKYKSFEDYDSIFIDINEKIYKVFPKYVKHGMTDVAVPKPKEVFIESLKNSIQLWNDTIPPQCQLYVKQQGAGNGKTFGIIQSIKDKAFQHYETFIYVTKQHSAKYIMYSELMKQQKEYRFEEYTIHTGNDQSIKQNNFKPKYYACKLIHKETGMQKHAIFSTIDSFMYAVGHKNESEYNVFMGIINNIIKDSDNTKLKMQDSKITFAGGSRILTKKTMFIVDECQDLSEEYARAIIKIMRATYMDCLVVGDILQSIHFERNAFRFFMSPELDTEVGPFIKRTKFEATNICQRFQKQSLVNFVNSVVKFNYNNLNLPNVIAANPIEDNESSVIFFKSHSVLDNEVDLIDNDSKPLTFEVDLEEIMKQFHNEVNLNNRKPNDFLFVTPFTSRNPLALSLEVMIQQYWESKLDEEDTSDFKRYAVFHRSEEGTSINLEESKDATRIVSCHAAKGDGRNVVFLIGFTEKNINRFSLFSDSLIFESMVNVMLTRVKDKLYIQYVANGDILHRRYSEYCRSIDNYELNVVPILPSISKFMKITTLVSQTDSDTNWEFFKNMANKADILYSEQESGSNQTIDMVHHNIRNQIMEIKMMLSILFREKELINDFRKKQHIRIFQMIKNMDICEYRDISKYNRAINELKKFTDENNKKTLPLLNLHGKAKNGETFHSILYKYILLMKQYAADLCEGKTKRIPCTFELIILYYIKETLNQGSQADINIITLYDILHKYDFAFQNSYIHENCQCRNHFKESEKTVDKLDLYHINFYEQLSIIDKHVGHIYEKYPNLAWLHNKTLEYYGKNEEFLLNNQITFHGYDDEKQKILLCYLKPQYTDLNDKDIAINIIMDTWLMMNFKRKQMPNDANTQKYYGKSIEACIVSLNHGAPVYITIEDPIKEANIEIKNYVYKNWIAKLSQIHEIVYFYYKYYRNNTQIQSTSKFCRDFLEKFSKHNKKFNVIYIRSFFQSFIGQESKKVLKKYDNKDFFLKMLNRMASNLLSSYLDLDLEMDSDESESSDSE
jgi:hypothetical protein